KARHPGEGSIQLREHLAKKSDQRCKPASFCRAIWVKKTADWGAEKINEVLLITRLFVYISGIWLTFSVRCICETLYYILSSDRVDSTVILSQSGCGGIPNSFAGLYR